MSGREIYRIRRTEAVEYDDFAGFVIVASDEQQCREFAKTFNPIGEPYYNRKKQDSWDSAEITVLGKPYKDTPSGVILDDFRAG